MLTNKTKFTRRKQRVRTRLRRQAEVGKGRPRLSIFRSGQHIYAQVIDDAKGTTLAAASSLDKELREALKSPANKEAAAAVGKLVAQRAVSKGVKEVAFDRGGYLFHGRVKALAEGAREGGLAF
jgi:large subunit ribosomal protein L18